MKTRIYFRTFIYALILLLNLPYAIVLATANPLQIVQQMSQSFENDLIEHQYDIKNNPLITSQIISQSLNAHVNFKLMSRYVLGKNWKKATPEQRQEFTLLFKALLIRFYSQAFNNYLKKNNVQKGMITFLPYREKAKSKYAKVKTEIKLNQGTTKLKVQYSLYNGKTKGWKIYDLSIEGISLVTSYRSSFKQIINKEKMSGLITHLENKLHKI